MKAKKGKDEGLFSENLFDAGECFWFTEYEYNALFRMDKKKERQNL